MRGQQDRVTVQVVAPMAGTVVDLRDVPDPVFSASVVGPGLALLPDATDPVAGPGGRVVVVAPCAGRLAAVYPHALMVRVDTRSVLVHLGLGTASLNGAGFDLAVVEDERVTVLQPLMAWSPADVGVRGLSTLSPVVAVQGDQRDVLQLVTPGDRVEEGQPLLLWS